MTRGTQLLVGVVALLLAGIFFELHGLNRRIDDAGAVVHQLGVGATRAIRDVNSSETEEERKQRIQAEQLRFERDALYRLTAREPQKSKSAATPRTAPPDAPRR